MPTYTKPYTLGDGFKYILNHAFNFESGIFRNTSGATRTIDSPVLLVVKKSSGKWVPVLATDEANAGGLLFLQTGITSLANNTDYSQKVAVAVRGPLLYNASLLPTADVAGTNYTAADLIARLATLQLVGVSEPTNSVSL